MSNSINRNLNSAPSSSFSLIKDFKDARAIDIDRSMFHSNDSTLKNYLAKESVSQTSSKKTIIPEKIIDQLRFYLQPDKNGKVDEESLYHALVRVLLRREKIDTERQFNQKFNQYYSSFGSRERATNFALRDLVRSGTISRNKGIGISNNAFDSAQLDLNKKTLFDGVGSRNDGTVAVESYDMAIKGAVDKLTNLPDRSAVSNNKINQAAVSAENKERVSTCKSIKTKVQNTSNIKSNEKTLESVSNIGNSKINNNKLSPSLSKLSKKGFLWKPYSDNDGRLVILTPKSYTGKVKGVSVHGLKDGQLKKISTGKFSSVANGDREHYRFKQSGDMFPKNSVVKVEFKNGQSIGFIIKEPAFRNKI